MFWKAKEFKALQKQWYQRLSDEGFKDAETLSEKCLTLKKIQERPYCAVAEVVRETREAYYTLMAQKVQEAVFRNEIDRLIMIWHADGMKACAIGRELTAIGEYRNRNTIRYLIRRYEHAWGMREYTPKELNRRV